MIPSRPPLLSALHLLAALIALLAGAACTSRPSSSTKEGAPAQGDQGSAYDPQADPLVNPARLLEPFPAAAPETAARDETLTRHLKGNPTSLNPIFLSSIYEFYFEELLFDGLFQFNAAMEWSVNGDMVESFEESADRLVSTVRLRPDRRWHDGRPFTARDVRFSWEAILDPQVLCPALKTGRDQLSEVRVLDDRTLQFVHKEALPTSRWNMFFPIIPEHIFGNPAERQKDPTLKTSEHYNHHAREEVIGNGPYRFVEWVANDRIVLERWEDFHGAKPHFKRQVFKIQPDTNTTLLLFNRGELDEMELTLQQFATQTGADFAAVGVKGLASQWGYAYIGWNMDGKTNPFFTDRRVRRAMAHALDLEHVRRTLTYNLAGKCYGIYHPDAPMFNQGIDLIPFDLDLARQLLDEAGWRASEEDGWRYKEVNGRPMKFEFTLTIPQGSTYGPRVAAIFGEDLKRIGVSLLTRTLEWATFQEQQQNHEHQAWIARWGTGTDPDTAWNLWRSEEYAGGRNYGGYSNARVDELYALGRRELDPAKRAAYYSEVQKLIYEDQPYLFLWNDAITWAFHKRLRGIQFSPRGVFNFDPASLAWWVHRDDKLR